MSEKTLRSRADGSKARALLCPDCGTARPQTPAEMVADVDRKLWIVMHTILRDAQQLTARDDGASYLDRAATLAVAKARELLALKIDKAALLAAIEHEMLTLPASGIVDEPHVRIAARILSILTPEDQ